MITKSDARYIYDTDDRRPVILEAWWNDVPCGGWADDDEDAFRSAVIDSLSHDLLPDARSGLPRCATIEEIVAGVEIAKMRRIVEDHQKEDGTDD